MKTEQSIKVTETKSEGLKRQFKIAVAASEIEAQVTSRLKELARQYGIDAYLIDGADEIKSSWLQGKTSIGVTAGASAPEILVEQVIQHLCTDGVDVVKMESPDEGVSFALPTGLNLKEHTIV